MDQSIPETVIVKTSKFGKGIFTTHNLIKDTVLFKITGESLNFENTLKLGGNQCYCLQTGMDKYIIPHYPFHLSNHSCNPNCGINNNLEFYTLRNINEGEELVWDYSTSMMEKHWVMKCDCGSNECRTIIRDFDLLPEQLQDKYLHMGVVLPYIVEYLYGLPKISDAKISSLYSVGR